MDITRSLHTLQELLRMGSHKQYSYQLKRWDEMVNAILLSKRLSDSYFCSIHNNDDQSNSNGLLKAFKVTSNKYIYYYYYYIYIFMIIVYVY